MKNKFLFLGITFYSLIFSLIIKCGCGESKINSNYKPQKLPPKNYVTMHWKDRQKVDQRLGLGVFAKK